MTPRLSVPTRDRLQQLIDGMAGQQVAMLVDLVLDRFITGTAKRISREAPVLILRHEGETLAPGGGANAVANIAALGGCPLPFGIVGDDESGSKLQTLFSDRGIATEGILIRPGYRTPTKTRILGGAPHGIKQQIVRYDIEDTVELSAEERQHLLTQLAQLAPQLAGAVFSDYGYGAVDPALLPGVRALLGDRPVLGDSRYRLAEFVGLDGATPNAEEAQALFAQLVPTTGNTADVSLATLEKHARALRRELDARFLLITRGSAGMSLFTSEDGVHLPVHGTDQVADVTGAGDTVIGTFTLALAAGAQPLEAALLANYAGGVVVMKMGTATLTPDELRTAVDQDKAPLENLVWDAS